MEGGGGGGRGGGGDGGGVSTLSMTWTTPLRAMMSATVTCASLMKTPELVTRATAISPAAVSISPLVSCVDSTPCPETTWYRSTLVSAPDGSASNASRVPAGSALKAASVGAKTVKGPSPSSAPTSSAATSAASRVWCDGLAATMAAMEGGGGGGGGDGNRGPATVIAIF